MSNVTPIDPTLYLFTGEPAHIDTDSQAMLVASYSELCSYSSKANDDELRVIVKRLGKLVRRFEPKA